MRSANKDDVEAFLKTFHQKMNTFGYVFANQRAKNAVTMAELGLKSIDVKKILTELTPYNYYKGPSHDIQGIYSNPLWEFGVQYNKDHELYIKITLGNTNSSVVCISLHNAERSINYPLKPTSQTVL